ncbi:MAG TPA: HYExAFE family protein, partial [Pirellulales bacterium]
MRRHNHYEAAFEEYLRERRAPYVAVDETRRALFEAGSLKSFDFLIAGPDRLHRLIDVKGRLFPAGGRRYWTNWLTDEDLTAATAWEGVFGSTFRAAWLFAYDVLGVRSPTPDVDLFPFRD